MEFNGVLTNSQIDFLSTLYIVSLAPSLIGSFSVLVVSIARWRDLREQVPLLVQLALADLCAGLLLMLTSAMNKAGSFRMSVALCQHALPLSLTFYLISFLLVVVYAWKSTKAHQGWRTQQDANETEQFSHCRRRLVTIPVYGIVWLFPIAMYLAYVLTPCLTTSAVFPHPDEAPNTNVFNETKYCTSCILFLHIWNDRCSDADIIHNSFVRGVLFLAVIPVLVSCTVLYCRVRKWYQRHEQEGLFPVEGDGRSRRRLKSMISTARNMVLIIIFCWTPAFVLIVMSTITIWTNILQQCLYWLYIMQALTLSLQGFLNSMVYAWRRPNFTEVVLGESTPLVMHESIAFFDESLRNTT